MANNNQGEVLGEKARLEQHFRRQEQQASSSSQSQSSPSHHSPSGSNSVPMTEEELPTPIDRPDEFPIPVPPSNAIPRVPVPAPRGLTPPPYSGPASPAQDSNSLLPSPDSDPSPGTGTGSSNPTPPRRYPGLPPLDYRLYRPPLFELSQDKTALKTTAPHFSANADLLVSLIRQQATVPPKPQLHVTGRRGSSATSGRIDFAVKLNLLPLIVPEDPRQRMDYLRCVGPGEVALRGGVKPSSAPDVEGEGGGLEAWAGRFVGDAATVKTFVLERQVVNLDMNWLEGQVRALVAAMKYPGTVAVTFPVTHARVVVQSPDRVNKFVTSLTGFFSGKRRYEVVRAVWPFATVPRGGEEGGERRCAVQSEETWWREWREPIRFAIASKRQGWVTNEDKLEALMEAMPANLADVDWGPEWADANGK